MQKSHRKYLNSFIRDIIEQATDITLGELNLEKIQLEDIQEIAAIYFHNASDAEVLEVIDSNQSKFIDALRWVLTPCAMPEAYNYPEPIVITVEDCQFEIGECVCDYYYDAIIKEIEDVAEWYIPEYLAELKASKGGM